MKKSEDGRSAKKQHIDREYKSLAKKRAQPDIDEENKEAKCHQKKRTIVQIRKKTGGKATRKIQPRKPRDMLEIRV